MSHGHNSHSDAHHDKKEHAHDDSHAVKHSHDAH
jgi:hypothetical protein